MATRYQRILNRTLRLTLLAAATLGLIILSVGIFPILYAFYIYPQTKSTTMIIDRDYADNNVYNETLYYHVLPQDQSHYPQIKEVLIHFRNVSSDYDISASYNYSRVTCAWLNGFNCRAEVHLKVADAIGILDAFQLSKYRGIEYQGYHYTASVADTDLQFVYNSTLLYGIAFAVVGSIAIWLIVSRVEARRLLQ